MFGKPSGVPTDFFYNLTKVDKLSRKVVFNEVSKIYAEYVLRFAFVLNIMFP